MAKKRVSVYMREEDLKWLEQYPAAESVSGSAVLLMEWTMKQIQRGAVTALEKLDDKEKRALTKYAKSAPMVADQSPYMLSTGLLDWFRFDQMLDKLPGMGLGWENSQISKLIEKISDMTPAEVMGLLCWARGYDARDVNDVKVV